MNTQSPKVDGYLRKNKTWQKELQALREIILETPLVEEVKWRVPCYTFEQGNVVFLGAFKEHCTLSFVKGALLKDSHHILTKPGENTQSARVIKFTDVEQIEAKKTILKAYIEEAIAIEKAGLKVAFKKTSEFTFPEEFQTKLDENPKLKAAFAALTPGRQRGYLLHFSGAKQSTTRASRVEKCTPRILSGKGLDDE